MIGRFAVASQDEADNDDDDDLLSMVPTGALPAYLSEAFADVYDEDGLVVMGKGLGLVALVASLVRFYGDPFDGHAAHVRAEAEEKKSSSSTAKNHASRPKPLPPPLVFVLGWKDSERAALWHCLESWGTPDERMPTVITNESGPGKDRAQLYSCGGVFFVTSRILIVDLLNNTVSSNDIDGFLVTHAEQVTEQSTEAFILRIFASQKQPYGSGFVKAFCQEPDQLLSGFAKVDKVLKALGIRNMYLYPRFHHAIRDELERQPPEVSELHQKLSPLQQDMQAALVVAVQSCLRELKSAAPTLLQWTDSELSIENCVTNNFDRTIAKQLEPEWHKLHPSTKQLVQDLRTLRTLFRGLLSYDCVSFWNLLTNLKTTSAQTRHPSLWLLTPAANVLFRKAKERVYSLVRPNPTKKVPRPLARLIPNLEINPKWHLLRQVLQEVQHEHQERRAEQHNNTLDEDNWNPTSVLIMVQDHRTLDALTSFLVEGKTNRTLLLRWLRYLEGINDRSRSRVVVDGTSSTTTSTTTSGAGATAAIAARTMDDMPEEDRLLLEEEGRVRRILFGTGQAAPQHTAKGTRKVPTTKLNELPNHVKKRRRIAKEKGRGDSTLQSEDQEQQAVLDDAIEATEHELLAAQNDARVLSQSAERENGTIGEESDSVRDLLPVYFGTELRIVLKSYTDIEGDDALLLLNEVRPQFVILYDTDMSFIRSVEIYSALRESTDPSVRVHFLMFEASAEEKTFRKSLEREQTAFERLIQHKKTMPPPAIQIHASQEMQQALLEGNGGVAGTYMGGLLPLAVDTRRGRGKLDTTKVRRDIAVDVREFRSALPSILHQGGMRLAPVTLTVGDFVLSTVHCVERKSISDLFGSFASGRLYTQAEAMCKHYKCPCLLIEFDPQKSFSLQNANELGSEIRTDSICR